jgi:hypothetical protein
MLLAQSGTIDILNILAPLALGSLAVLAIVIVALTKHQRRMAELFHTAPKSDALVEEVRSMRAEMRRLEAKVDALGLSLPAPAEGLTKRLENPLSS